MLWNRTRCAFVTPQATLAMASGALDYVELQVMVGPVAKANFVQMRRLSIMNAIPTEAGALFRPPLMHCRIDDRRLVADMGTAVVDERIYVGSAPTVGEAT